MHRKITFSFYALWKGVNIGIMKVKCLVKLIVVPVQSEVQLLQTAHRSNLLLGSYRAIHV